MTRGAAVCVGLVAGVLATVAVYAKAGAQVPDGQKKAGTVALGNDNIPLSNLLSPEARSYMIHLLADKPFAGGPSAEQDIKGYRARQDEIMRSFLAPIEKRYPAYVKEQMIAGVFAQVVTPRGGVSEENRDRILLNLHGGGFISGARTASLVESIPIASIEKIKVVSVDYRMGPEAKFPAASEDVAAVYGELLKQYAPQHIGIYGCSAGGMLTGMSIAWFQAHHLPNPAAIGVLCASLGRMFSGDSAYLAGPLMGVPAPVSVHPVAGPQPREFPAYLRNANPDDPLVYPIASPALLAKFPPTLLITSTRGFEYSSAVNSANALERAGVSTELRVWDGLPHAFWYNSDLPESRDVYAAIAEFFHRHLHP